MNDAIKESAKLNPSTTGEFEWILVPSREEWNCECAEYAVHGPYKADELPEIPAHPNCVCQIRPVLKKWEDFKKELLESDGNNLPDLDEWISGGVNDVEEQLLEIPKFAPMSAEEAARDVNPNLKKSLSYRINCPYCTAADELRHRGFDVEAMPMKRGKDRAVRIGYEFFENPQVIGMNSYTNTDTLLPNEVIQQLNTYPDGARFGIIMKFDKKYGGLRHVFNCEKINGELKFYDAQDPSRNAKEIFLKETSMASFFRMDNLKLNKNIDWKKAVKKK